MENYKLQTVQTDNLVSIYKNINIQTKYKIYSFVLLIFKV
jgi:hypothetical protein